MVHLSLFILQCLHQLETKFSHRSSRETLNKTSLYENGEKTSKVGKKDGSALNPRVFKSESSAVIWRQFILIPDNKEEEQIVDDVCLVKE